MEKPSLFRRRYIPNEIVHLKDDEIISYDEDVILTKWKVLKPRIDFNNGYSCYYLKKGFKVSKFLKDDDLVYTYCDIIDCEYHDNGEIIINDLLIDVIIENTGFVKVVDLHEIPIALDKGIISIDKCKKALNITNELLQTIYSGKVDSLMEPFINVGIK